jgi:hypothetical protein
MFSIKKNKGQNKGQRESNGSRRRRIWRVVVLAIHAAVSDVCVRV